jgi:predicted ATPase
MSSEQPRLQRLVIQHYKSIVHCDVELGNLTFLVGPNGAGKSNFLDALMCLADFIRLGYQEFIEK